MPYVVETSIGVDRMFLQVMSAAYTEEQLEGGDSRVVLRLPAALAPVKVAILPLVKKDGMPEVAQKIVDELKYDYNVSTTRRIRSASATVVRMPSVRLSASPSMVRRSRTAR